MRVDPGLNSQKPMLQNHRRTRRRARAACFARSSSLGARAGFPIHVAPRYACCAPLNLHLRSSTSASKRSRTSTADENQAFRPGSHRPSKLSPELLRLTAPRHSFCGVAFSRTRPSLLSSSTDAGYHPSTSNGARLPCHATAGHGDNSRGPLLLAGHSHAVAFEPPGRPSQAPRDHPGCHTASRLRRTRRSSGHVAIRLNTGGLALHVPSSRSATVTERPCLSLSGGRTQKLLPYPSTSALRVSAPSPDKLTGKPYGFGPLMVELFTARLLTESPKLVELRLHLSPGYKLPTPARVERWCSHHRTPRGGFTPPSSTPT